MIQGGGHSPQVAAPLNSLVMWISGVGYSTFVPWPYSSYVLNIERSIYFLFFIKTIRSVRDYPHPQSLEKITKIKEEKERATFVLSL